MKQIIGERFFIFIVMSILKDKVLDKYIKINFLNEHVINRKTCNQE